ncbi:TolC family protein [Parabacteroides pacaensis]|uniref:TolC family protein n=1 Tax=Parabacteroides pacaensis TaxID=2086575 RepID=UPI000D0EEE2F|nr:TolC family protein [Parabacteroides pacaensis]
MKYNNLFWFFVLLFPAFIKAQTLSLKECREMALENNAQIAISRWQVKQAGYTLKSYKANFLPKFSGEGMYLFSGSKLKETTPELYLPTYVPDATTGQLIPNIIGGGTDGNKLFKQYAYVPPISLELSLNNTYLAGVSVEQPLYMGGKIRAAYQMALIGKDISQLNIAYTRTDMLVKTDEAYWQLVKVKEMLLSARKYREVIDELLKNVSDACEIGMKSRNDFLKVQVKLNEAELMVRKAENGIRLARLNLCHYIGLPLQTEIEVADTLSLESPVLDALPAVHVTNRTEYELLSRQIEYKHQATKLVRSDFLPNLGVSAAYFYTDGMKLNEEKLLSSGSFSALFSLKVPLFHWGEGINKVRAAKAEKTIAILQREDALEKMELEAMQALNTLDEAVMEVELTRNSLAQAEENLKVSKDYYEAGMETLTDYMEAQAVWQKAWSDLISAKAGMRISETHYLKAIGKLK